MYFLRSCVFCFFLIQSAQAQEVNRTKPVSQASSKTDAQAGSQGQSSSDAAQSSAEANEHERLEQARREFLKGMEAFQAGEFETAEPHFQAAARVKSTPGLLYYIAYCQEQLQDYELAYRSYSAAEKGLAKSPAEDVQALLPPAIERVRARLVRVELKTQPEHAMLQIDGKKIDSALLFLAPGEHQVLVQAEGYLEHQEQLQLELGQARELEVELQALPAQVQSVALQEPATKSRAKAAVFWASVGVAIAGVGVGSVGAVLFANATADRNRYDRTIDEAPGGGDRACVAPPANLADDCRYLSRAVQNQADTRTVMIVGYSVAVAAATSALLTHFLWKNPSPQKVASWKVGADFSPSHAQLRVSSSF